MTSRSLGSENRLLRVSIPDRVLGFLRGYISGLGNGYRAVSIPDRVLGFLRAYEMPNGEHRVGVFQSLIGF